MNTIHSITNLNRVRDYFTTSVAILCALSTTPAMAAVIQKPVLVKPALVRESSMDHLEAKFSAGIVDKIQRYWSKGEDSFTRKEAEWVRSEILTLQQQVKDGVIYIDSSGEKLTGTRLTPVSQTLREIQIEALNRTLSNIARKLEDGGGRGVFAGDQPGIGYYFMRQLNRVSEQNIEEIKHFKKADEIIEILKKGGVKVNAAYLADVVELTTEGRERIVLKEGSVLSSNQVNEIAEALQNGNDYFLPAAKPGFIAGSTDSVSGFEDAARLLKANYSRMRNEEKNLIVFKGPHGNTIVFPSSVSQTSDTLMPDYEKIRLFNAIKGNSDYRHPEAKAAIQTHATPNRGGEPSTPVKSKESADAKADTESFSVSN